MKYWDFSSSDWRSATLKYDGFPIAASRMVLGSSHDGQSICPEYTKVRFAPRAAF
jgi:hypothetical protein